MLPRVESSLRDIAIACGEILDHSKGDEDRIIEDRLLALAIERLLLIVSEAMVRIRDDAPDLLDSIRDARAIIGMRNAIVHGYDTIDPVRIRDAVKLAVRSYSSMLSGY